MLNRKFNNLPLLDQIKRLHQQIHRLNGVLNNGSSKFTPTYIPFGDGDGDLTEKSSLAFDVATSTLLVGDQSGNRGRLVIDDGNTGDARQMFFDGVDKFTYRWSDFLPAAPSDIIEFRGGTRAVPTQTKNSQDIHYQSFRTQDTAGSVQTRFSRIMDLEIVDDGGPGEAHYINTVFNSIGVGNIFGMTGKNGAVTFGQYGTGVMDAATLGKVESGYVTVSATDGTQLDKPIADLGAKSFASFGMVFNSFGVTTGDALNWQARESNNAGITLTNSSRTITLPANSGWYEVTAGFGISMTLATDFVEFNTAATTGAIANSTKSRHIASTSTSNNAPNNINTSYIDTASGAVAFEVRVTAYSGSIEVESDNTFLTVKQID